MPEPNHTPSVGEDLAAVGENMGVLASSLQLSSSILTITPRTARPVRELIFAEKSAGKKKHE